MDKPSRKFDLIGISTVLPVALAIRPRIPPTCLIWFLEPLAPELAMMNRLFKEPKESIRASATSSVALVQILMICSYLSWLDIKPLLKAFSYLSTSFSAAARISVLASGISMSLTLIVTAPFVEYL